MSLSYLFRERKKIPVLFCPMKNLQDLNGFEININPID